MGFRCLQKRRSLGRTHSRTTTMLSSPQSDIWCLFLGCDFISRDTATAPSPLHFSLPRPSYHLIQRCSLACILYIQPLESVINCGGMRRNRSADRSTGLVSLNCVHRLGSHAMKRQEFMGCGGNNPSPQRPAPRARTIHESIDQSTNIIAQCNQAIYDIP